MSRSDDDGEIEYDYGNAPGGNGFADDGTGYSERPCQPAMMVYDTNGKAIPTPTGTYYYDRWNAAKDGNDNSDTEGDAHVKCCDTERANKPASLDMSSHSGSNSSEYCSDDASALEEDDQFMRIQVAAAPLKDVNRVKKDKHHDKPSRKTPSIVGMVRALSSVRAPSTVSDTEDRERGSRSSSTYSAEFKLGERKTSARALREGANSRPSIGAVGRILSLTRTKTAPSSCPPPPEAGSGASPVTESISPVTGVSQPSGVSSSGGTPVSSPLESIVDGVDQLSACQNPTTNPTAEKAAGVSFKAQRHGIASVGRLLSLSRRSQQEETRSPRALRGTSPFVADVVGGEPSQSPRSGSRTSASSISEIRSEGGRNERQGPKTSERPEQRNSQSGRKSLQQIGRMMSMSKRRTQTSDAQTHPSQSEAEGTSRVQMPVDRERQDSAKPPGLNSRMGVKQVGRMLSLSKRQHESLARPGVNEREAASDPSERERGAPAAASSKKDITRPGLKNAGRLLSFSRKPNPSAERPALEERKASGQLATGDPSTPMKSIQNSFPSSSISPKLDGRANKFFFSDINSPEIRSHMNFNGDTRLRVPVLVMAEYSGPVSRSKWFIDAFTLPHNAFRRECIDMYDILMALAKSRPEADITMEDLRDFHSWWITAHNFFRTYFEMEREVLFPWVDAAGANDWELQMALRNMRNMKDGLHVHLEHVNAAWNNLGKVPPGALFCEVYKAIDAFCPRAMNYFSDQELLLPQIVKSVYRIEDRLVMDKEMLAVFMGERLTRKNKDLPHHNLVILVRWIANPKQHRAWIMRNLNLMGRSSYATWHAQYEAQHARIVKGFRNRARISAATGIAQS